MKYFYELLSLFELLCMAYAFYANDEKMTMIMVGIFLGTIVSWFLAENNDRML